MLIGANVGKLLNEKDLHDSAIASPIAFFLGRGFLAFSCLY